MRLRPLKRLRRAELAQVRRLVRVPWIAIAGLLASGICVAACATSRETRVLDWTYKMSEGRIVQIEVQWAPLCEMATEPQVIEATDRVDIQLPYSFDPTRRECGSVGRIRTVTLELEMPLADRLLTGCQPVDADALCRLVR